VPYVGCIPGAGIRGLNQGQAYKQGADNQQLPFFTELHAAKIKTHIFHYGRALCVINPLQIASINGRFCHRPAE